MATYVGFAAVILSAELAIEEGLARLGFALFVEYVADFGVWSMLEFDGYHLTNVVFRFDVGRTMPLVIVLLAALACEWGNG